MKKVVGYCRVSTTNQREEGTIELQHHTLTAYAKENGMELVGFFDDDGVSGSLDIRPGLTKLFNYIVDKDNSVGAVLIYKLDRLARDQYVQETIIRRFTKSEILLISTKEPDLCSKDPTRKMIRQILGAIGEQDCANITARLTLGRLGKIRDKKKYAGGGVALGYTAINQDLVIDDEAAETVKLIFKMKKGQRKSLSKIARELNAKAIPTARGGKWWPMTIRKVLSNPLYKGNLSYAGVYAKRADLALI